MTDIHRHKCGYDARSSIELPGCGHTWEHDGDKLGEPGEKEGAFERAHFCPACGRGPWTFRYDPVELAQVGLKKVCKLLAWLDELENRKGLRL